MTSRKKVNIIDLMAWAWTSANKLMIWKLFKKVPKKWDGWTK